VGFTVFKTHHHVKHTYIAQCPKGDYSAIFTLYRLASFSFCFVLMSLVNMKINLTPVYIISIKEGRQK
jgi:hypothetical protein